MHTSDEVPTEMTFDGELGVPLITQVIKVRDGLQLKKSKEWTRIMKYNS